MKSVISIVSLWLAFLFLSNLFISTIGAYENLAVDELDIDLGYSEGLSKTSTVSGDNLKKILDGVENGNPNNIYFYGLLKLYGISVTKDLVTSSQNFHRASSLGHVEATTAYGLALLNGMGVKKDHIQAVQFFRKAVELGDMNAHWLLAKMLMEGKGVTIPHYAEAAHFLSLAASEESNVPQALYLLALMYEYGRGEVAQNLDLAVKYYRRAVEQRHVESTYNLAMMYAFGRGVPEDFNKARGLLETSAASNHAPSIYYVGVFKTYGYGCEINYEQAANWFERAAGLGDDRVSDKAYRAAGELRALIDHAHVVNNEVLDGYMVKNEGR